MERLQKVMAEAGVASRRHCEEIIAEGRVTVNGKLIEKLPCLVDKFKDRIIVDERKLRFDKKVYYLLNKPKRVICTNHDPDNRRRTVDLLNDVKERVYPVGRLDADSQGLVIMTNDGELANELTHPRYGVPKTYIAEIATCIEAEDVEKLKRGFFISKGGKACMDKVRVLKKDRKFSLLEITLREGRNRQIRRMLQRLGHNVKRLTRVSFGPLSIKGCGVGKHRMLKPQEVELLKESVEKYKAIAKEDAKKKPRKVVRKQTVSTAEETPVQKPVVKKVKKVKKVSASSGKVVKKTQKKAVVSQDRVARNTVYGKPAAPNARGKKVVRAKAARKSR